MERLNRNRESPSLKRRRAEKEPKARLTLSQLDRPLTVTEHVYRVLHERLLHGDLGPNERITEKDVTEQLSVSRTPVREAFAKLASEGFLVATKRGYKVPDFSLTDIADISEARLLLEPAAARRVTENPSPETLRDMQQAINREISAHAKGDVEAFLQAHLAFRTAWLAQTQNPLLAGALRKTIHALQLIRRRTMSDSLMREFLIDSHKLLLAAIIAGDPNRSELVQAERIRRFRDLLLDRVFKNAGATAMRTD
jgi:DNA-binding GntR family transcriptional regulator